MFGYFSCFAGAVHQIYCVSNNKLTKIFTPYLEAITWACHTLKRSTSAFTDLKNNISPFAHLLDRTYLSPDFELRFICVTGLLYVNHMLQLQSFKLTFSLDPAML